MRSPLRVTATVLILFLHGLATHGQSPNFLTDGGEYISQLPEVNVETGPQPSMEQLLSRLKETESHLAIIQLEHELLMHQLEANEAGKPDKSKEEKNLAWYEKYGIRGYAQFRINETIDLAPGSARPQHVGDSSIGDNQNFLIRRARLIFFGDVSERIALYFQPDFASNVPGSPDNNQFAQIRDLYADIYLDLDKVYRFRVGQSKVPYGFENLQSSQNRLPLDRNDAFNSAVKNERDLGAFFYWTPEWAQQTFKSLVDDGLKGSGNYGVFGMGFYNGQGGSLREQNDNLHFVTRLTVPHTFESGQIVEAGVQAYTGKYTVLSSAISPLGVGPTARPLGTLETGNEEGIVDDRLGATLVYYPQPWGFQAEWTVGRGPCLNSTQTEVVDGALYGGYGMTMYRIQTECYGEFFPFFRAAFFQGGYKSERNAPDSDISEYEIGLEWQFSKSLELVSMYTMTDRTNTQALGTANTLSYTQFEGDLLRFQLQVNY